MTPHRARSAAPHYPAPTSNLLKPLIAVIHSKEASACPLVLAGNKSGVHLVFGKDLFGANFSKILRDWEFHVSWLGHTGFVAARFILRG